MNINDNSLCNIDFSKKATKKSVQDYIIALLESGIDLIEVDYKSVVFLDDVNTSAKFIYRVECIPDLVILKEKEFAYVSIPYNMLPVAQKLSEIKLSSSDAPKKISYLIEVGGDGKTVEELLAICRKINSSECAAIIRIAMNFNTDDGSLSDFIDRYYDEFNIPLDICPLNSNLNGTTAAYEAFEKNVNMITLSFGSPYLYTPYELFVLYFPSSLGLSPAAIFTPRLYIAAVRFNAVSDSENLALKNMNDVLDSAVKGAVNIDIAKDNTSKRRRVKPRTNPTAYFTNVQSAFCENTGMDSEMNEAFSDALDNFDMSLYNRFLSKDDFKN